MRGKLGAGQSDDSEELLNRAKQKQSPTCKRRSSAKEQPALPRRLGQTRRLRAPQPPAPPAVGATKDGSECRSRSQ